MKTVEQKIEREVERKKYMLNIPVEVEDQNIVVVC